MSEIVIEDHIREQLHAFEQALEDQNIIALRNVNMCTVFDPKKNEYFPSDLCNPMEYDQVQILNLAWVMWQARGQTIPAGMQLVPKELSHAQAVKISDDPNFFETYQTILHESESSEDAAVILIQTAHKAMIEVQGQSNE